MFYLLIYIQYSIGKQCIWIDSSNNSYDYSKLDQKGGWNVMDTQNGMGMFNMVYVFNFCKIDLNCHFIPVAVYEGLKVMEEMTDNCDVVGIESTRTITHIPEQQDSFGIQISFNDDSQCIEKVSENKNAVSNKPRKAEFNVICSNYPDDNFKITQSYGCTTIFEIHHPAGCIGGGSLHNLSTLIIQYLLSITIIYLFIGIFYNKLIHKEIKFPNTKFWIEFGELIFIGIRYSISLIKNNHYNGYALV